MRMNNTSSDADSNTTDSCSVNTVHAVAVVEHVGYLIIIPAICVSGVVMNILCILIFRDTGAELASCVYLLVRCVSDLVTCILVMPVGLTQCGICFPDDADVLDDVMRAYNLYVYIPIANMSSMTSILLTAAVTVERYVLVRWRRVSTKQYRDRQASLVSACLLAGSVLLNIPYFFRGTYVEDNVLDFFATTPSTPNSWIRVVVAKFMTTIIVAVFNTLLIVELRKSSQRKNTLVSSSVHETRRRQRKGRVTSMLVTVSLGFLIAHIPTCLAHPGLFKTLFGTCSVHTTGYKVFRLICNVLEMSCYAGSFVIFWTWSETCRRVLRSVCLGCTRNCSRHKNVVQSEVSAVNRSHSALSARSARRIRHLSNTVGNACIPELKTIAIGDIV